MRCAPCKPRAPASSSATTRNSGLRCSRRHIPSSDEAALFTPQILRKGPLPAATLAPTGEAWRSHPDYDEAVRETWNRYVDTAKARGHHLWDGTHYRLLREQDLHEPVLRLGTVPFRYVATYRALNESHRAHALEPFHHISTAALFRTADGHYVFGKRAINGSVDLIGGGFQPEEGTPPDLEANLRKEIREELGIGADGLSEIRCLGVVRSTTSNVLVISHVEAFLTRDEVLEAFERREEDEMAEPVFVPQGEVARFLQAMTDYRTLLPDLLRAR